MFLQSKKCVFGAKIIKVLAGLALVWILFPLIGFQRVEVKAGHEAVVIDKPWLFGDEGVREGSVKSGHVTVSVRSNVIQLNMQPQYAELTAEDVRSKDLPEASDSRDDGFAATVKFSYQFADARAYALRGDPYWFTDRMDFVFRDRVIQEYAGFTRAQMNVFPEFSQKINANLVAGFNEDLRKASIPVQVLDVRVSPQHLRL